MIDKNKFLDESEIPIPVPSTDEAWKAMLKKLEEDDPKLIPAIGARKNPIGWIIPGIALLLLMLWLGLFMPKESIVNEGDEKSNQVSGNNSNNQSGELSKADKKKVENIQEEEDYSSGQNNANPNMQDKKDVTINEQEIKDPVSRITSENNSVKNKSNSNKSSVNRNRKKSSASKLLNHEVAEQLMILNEDHFKYSDVNYPLLSANEIKKPLFPKKKIYGDVADGPVPVQNNYWLMEAGLEWNVPIPFSSGRNILDGPNGEFQPYRIILPGAWVRLEAGKHSMSLGLNPFYTTLLPNTPFDVLDSVATSADTTTSFIETKTLRKLFGLSGAFEYNYNFSDRLWAGIGIQATFWGNGLIGLNEEVQKVPLNGSPAINNTYTSERSITDVEWSNFSKSQIGLTAQFFYRKKPWDAGIRLSLPVTPLAKQDGPSNPFRAEFLFRIKLIDWRIKQ